ncbi:MAG: hypoxanthine phosphoribosyltransferase [Bacteroidota bacterium]
MDNTITINGDTFVLYLSEKQIMERVQNLGRRLNHDYAGSIPIFIGVLNGSFIFLADLIREITIDCEIDFIKLSSYGDAKITSGDVRVLKNLNCQVKDRDIVIVEDIVDSGLSIDFFKRLIISQNPRSVKVVTLLYKKGSTKYPVEMNYVGFEIPSLFVIGYGLDYAQKVRNLRNIYILQQ